MRKKKSAQTEAEAKATVDLAERLECELLGDGRRVSPPLDVKRGAKTIPVRFVQLSDHRKQMLRIEAMGWVESMRKRVEGKYRTEEIRDGQVVWEELREARWNALIVHAATRKAADLDTAAFTEHEMEESGSSDLIGFLGAKYHDFEDEWDPDQITAESIEAITDLLKKNALSLPELWRRCGFATLSACLLSLAGQVVRLETELSSHTSFTEASP